MVRARWDRPLTLTVVSRCDTLAHSMTTASRTSSHKLSPIWVVRLLRSVARAFRGLRRKLLSIPAFRDISDEVLFSEFTPAEQFGHEMLVADTIRMNAYRAGIRRNVKAGDVVVDPGTGTGILAMLAAQQNAKVVHAIDSSDFVFLAERIAAANRFTNIVFHKVSSRRFVLDESVDVILHEQIGQALVDEGMIEKTLDLKTRLSANGGRILPGRFELFLEPVGLKDGYRVPYLWQTKFPGIDFGSVKEWPEHFKLSGQDWQVGTRAAIDYFLCEPSPILAFDLNEITDASEVPSRVSASRSVRRSGRMDGLCLYFRVIFDDEVQFDTSPFSPRTVWDNLHLRVTSREYRQGDPLTYSLHMKDRFGFETWTVDITSPASARAAALESA